MIKNWRLKLARYMVRRRIRPVRFVTALATWLPFWCLPIAAALYFGPGFGLLLVLPVLVVGRYFVARRVADAVVGKLYDIARLQQPLAQTLRKMGEFEPGLVGVRLETIGELLEYGMTLAEALRLALPEIPQHRLGAIAASESQGRLVTELNHQATIGGRWDIFAELDASMLVYFPMLPLAIAVTVYFLSRFTQRYYAKWHIPVWRYPLLAVSHGGVALVLSTASVLLPILVGGILLRRLVAPFFRPANWFLSVRDAVLWRLPILGRIAQDQSWASVAHVMADALRCGVPLDGCCGLAGAAAANRVAGRRMRRWERLLAGGMEPASSARKAGVPRMIRAAIANPVGTAADAGLLFAAHHYRRRYEQTMAWVHAAAIPVSVLVLGTGVLSVMLMAYLPYTQLLSLLCRSVK